MRIALFGNTLLRAAIQRNLVSFPATIPPFTKRDAGSGDVQERIVQLYFVRGWSVRNLCERYQLSKAVVQNLLAEWRVRAIAAGFIQEIDQEGVARIAATEYGDDAPAALPAMAGMMYQPPASTRTYAAGQ